MGNCSCSTQGQARLGARVQTSRVSTSGPSPVVPLTHRSRREAYYTAIKDDPELHVKLTGSWETVVGEQDVFCMRRFSSGAGTS